MIIISDEPWILSFLEVRAKREILFTHMAFNYSPLGPEPWGSLGIYRLYQFLKNLLII